MTSIKFGTVKNLDSRTGDGWITPIDGGSDIRVRRNEVEEARLGQLANGQILGFEIAGDDPRAVELWATWSNR